MVIVTSKTAGEFIARTKFPAKPTRKNGITNTPPVELGSVEAQTLVVGSGLVVAGKAVPRQTREDLVNCTLFAQLAASGQVERSGQGEPLVRRLFPGAHRAGLGAERLPLRGL